MNVEAGCCLTESPGYAHSLFLGRGQKRCASKSRNKPCKTILIFFPQCSHKGPRRKHAGCLCSSLKRLERYHCESCTVWLGRRLSINPHGFTSPLFPSTPQLGDSEDVMTAKLEVHNCGPDPHRSGSIPRPCSFSVVWKVGTERSFRVSCHWTAGAPGCRFILVRRRKELIMLFNWSQQGTRLIHLFPLWLEAR